MHARSSREPPEGGEGGADRRGREAAEGGHADRPSVSHANRFIPPGEPRTVHATPRFLVIEKPPWMLSVPGKGPAKADCVPARIAARYPRARGPLIVHRLDMETSGLMVLGLDEDAQRDLSRQFEERVVEKQYVALVRATASPPRATPRADPLQTSDHGELSLPLRADLDNRPYQIVDPIHGREAITRWRLLARETDRLRILFEPLTGRTHQIRIHAALGLGRPIIGDLLYGGDPADRLMLHASRLSFLDPATRARVEFDSRPPF
ncbi:MAG: RluA family pseudouridine synthase [Phycisphaerales bacterium]